MTANTLNHSFDDKFTKHIARNIVFNETIAMFPAPLNQPLKALTLMGNNPELELNLQQYYGDKIKQHSLEISLPKYKRQQKIAAKAGLSINLYQQADKEHFLTNSDKYNVVWIDRCSSRCESVHDMMKNLFQNGIELVNGQAFLGLTLAASREQDEWSKLETTEEEREMIRLYYAPKLWQSFALMAGFNIVPVTYYLYHEFGMPMILYVWKVVKSSVESDISNVNIKNLTVRKLHTVLPKTKRLSHERTTKKVTLPKLGTKPKERIAV